MDEFIQETTLRNAISGDEMALGELLWRDYDRLAGHVEYSIPPNLRSMISTDDVLQETLTAAWQKFHTFSYRDERSFFGWLKTIASRKLIDRIRFVTRQKRGRAERSCTMVATTESSEVLNLLEAICCTNSGPSSVVAGYEAAEKLHEAMVELSHRHRCVLQYRYFEGLQPEAVAERMNCSVGAVHMLTQRAIDSLRRLMGRESQFFTMR